MEDIYTVALSKVIDELSLETIYLPGEAENILVSVARVNRPGLPLAGFYDHYERERIQIIGKVEKLYLDQLCEKARAESLETFFATRPCAVIITTNQEVSEQMCECARRFGVPLLRTSVSTSEFMANLIAFLNVQLAPRITRHGVLVEVYGEGILLLVGVEPEDTVQHARLLARKTAQMRVFRDENGKRNRSVLEIGGGVLAVSQLTLCADTRRGRRPDFFGRNDLLPDARERDR